jgi:predicted Zn-dependent protease
VSTYEIVRAALDGLTEGSVILRAAHSRNLRWANSAVTTNGDMRSLHLTVVAHAPAEAGRRVAVVSGQVADPDGARALSASAQESAPVAPEVDAAALPEGSAEPDATASEVDLDPGAVSRMTQMLEQFLASPAGQFGYAETDRVTTYLATTAGTAARRVQDSVRFEASARDATGSTWWGTNAWDADVPAAIAGQRRSLALQAAREPLDAGRHRVLLTPSAVADLLIYLAWSANGRDAVEGHNVFSRPGGGTRLGDTLTDRPMTLFADPGYPGLATSDLAIVEANSSMESVFDNGLPVGRRDLISDGRLTALRASRPTADRVGLPPVYLADNLVLEDASGRGDLGDLVARTEDAILVTCLWYIREVDPQNLLLTGLTRDGVYRIRDGELVAAVPNFRFNVAVPDLLAQVVDATATAPCLPREWADWFTRTAMPALLVEDFNLSSPSEAL